MSAGTTTDAGATCDDCGGPADGIDAATGEPVCRACAVDRDAPVTVDGSPRTLTVEAPHLRALRAQLAAKTGMDFHASGAEIVVTYPAPGRPPNVERRHVDGLLRGAGFVLVEPDYGQDHPLTLVYRFNPGAAIAEVDPDA